MIYFFNILDAILFQERVLEVLQDPLDRGRRWPFHLMRADKDGAVQDCYIDKHWKSRTGLLSIAHPHFLGPRGIVTIYSN